MTDPTPLLNGKRRPPNSFVLPEHKVVYISVTKVACTSLRWMVADLAGEDLESFYATTGAHQTRLMTIHRNRDHWHHVPQLHTMPYSEIDRISRDKGWFIFAVIRDPWSRLWSGWQSKFLVRHQPYVDSYGDEPWFPRVPNSQEEVVEDFRKFVFARPWETNPELKTDVHFKPQTYSVRPELVNYSKLYDLSDMAGLFADLHAHLQGIGKDKELYLPRANDTPLPLIREAMKGDVAAVIEDAYKSDFEHWGDRWSLDRVKMQDSWSADALAYLRYHTVANQRIGDMRNAARELTLELHSARRELKLLEKRFALLWTPRRVARGVARRVRDRLHR